MKIKPSPATDATTDGAPAAETVPIEPSATVEPPATLLTDEGVPFAWMTPALVVNVCTDGYDAKRRELHVNGIPFSHVDDTVEGHWIYRHDH